MRQLSVVAAIFVAILGVANAEPKKPIVPKDPIVIINNHGSYDRGTFPRKGEWLGLFCKATSCEIRNAVVHISSSRKENILGDKEKTDELSVEEDPVALFYGVQLKLGPVVTWLKSENSMYESSHYQKLQKLGRWQMPWGKLPLTLFWVKLPESGGFRYHLSDGKVKQFLFATEIEGHYGGETTPFVHWVGDLDGDGMIDFLLSIPDDNCGFDGRLYLSSKAGEGKLIRKAAQTFGRQPACGC